MGPFLWLLLAALVTAVAGLSIKLHLMRRAAGEIARGFQEKLRGDTNTLIDISSRDKAMRELASGINAELRRLRRGGLGYQQGGLGVEGAGAKISPDLRAPPTAICGYL